MWAACAWKGGRGKDSGLGREEKGGNHLDSNYSWQIINVPDWPALPSGQRDRALLPVVR